MKATAKNEPKGNPELGLKLMNFRKKLGFSIGQKKITQDQFADMFGVPSGRALASYELGDSEAPASLIYRFWQAGNSIDNIFGDGPITDAGKEKAKTLYDQAISAMSDAESDRLLSSLEEKNDAEKTETGADKKAIVGSTGSGKTLPHTTRKIKKR